MKRMETSSCEATFFISDHLAHWDNIGVNSARAKKWRVEYLDALLHPSHRPNSKNCTDGAKIFQLRTRDRVFMIKNSMCRSLSDENFREDLSK